MNLSISNELLESDEQQIEGLLVDSFYGKLDRKYLGIFILGLQFIASKDPEFGGCDHIFVARDGEKLIGVSMYCRSGIGGYEYNHTFTEDMSVYKNKKGLHGEITCILREYQNKGIGRMLFEEAKKIEGIDYIYGLQDKKVGTIGFWKKMGRRVIGESDDDFITLIDLK